MINDTEKIVDEDYYKDWEITTNRYVAFLDIMGFKDRVARSSHEDVLVMMNKIYDFKYDTIDINDLLFGNNCFITTFSDSIILFSKDDIQASKESFFESLCSMFSLAFSYNIPMKGAVAYGKTTVNRKKSLFFGQSIIDAFLLQEELFYYGVVFHHSAEDLYNDEYIHKNMFEVKTILKSGNISHYNLAYWMRYENFDCLIKEHLDEMKKHVSGRPRIYIDNTMEMFNRWKILDDKRLEENKK